MIGGYNGKFLRVNLSSERLADEAFDEETLKSLGLEHVIKDIW